MITQLRLQLHRQQAQRITALIRLGGRGPKRHPAEPTLVAVGQLHRAGGLARTGHPMKHHRAAPAGRGQCGTGRSHRLGTADKARRLGREPSYRLDRGVRDRFPNRRARGQFDRKARGLVNRVIRATNSATGIAIRIQMRIPSASTAVVVTEASDTHHREHRPETLTHQNCYLEVEPHTETSGRLAMTKATRMARYGRDGNGLQTYRSMRRLGRRDRLGCIWVVVSRCKCSPSPPASGR
jgi:hypothetical protein